MILYHWTHRDNVKSIQETGLDPMRASGAYKCSWACDSCRVGWAMRHIADRHDWPPDAMVLLECVVLPSQASASASPFVYSIFGGVKPARIKTIRAGILAKPAKFSTYQG